MTTTEADLLVGIAGVFDALLTDGPDPARQTYTYRPTGAYEDGDGFGFYMDIAPENGLDAITLADYPVSEDMVGGDAVIGVQFRIVSHDRKAIKDVVSDLRDRLHGRWGGSLGDVTLIQATRSSGTNVGQDANGRLVRTENYYLTIYRP